LRALFAILLRIRPSLREGLGRRFAWVMALSSLAGATAGLLPAVIGVALDAVLGRRGAPSPGLAGAFTRLVAGLSPWGTIAAALAATLAVTFASVTASAQSSALAGEVVAALRIAMLRAALFASPHDVEAAGILALAARGGEARGDKSAPPPSPLPAPPGARPMAAAARGGEIVKLTIAREAGLVADFAVALLSGLPQAVATLVVLAFQLIAGGASVVLAGGVALFAISRLAADRAARRVSRAMGAMQAADAVIFARLGEALAATEDLRLLGARGAMVLEFAAAAHRVADARRSFTRALAASGQMRGVFSAVAPLLILVAVLRGGAAGAGAIGELLLVIPLLFARLEALDALRSGLIERAPLLRAALALLDLPAAPPESDGARSVAAALPPAGGGALTFTSVSFTPRGAAAPIVDGVSLAIPAGAVVGICGRSGSGKSSLARLLLRLDDPTAGSIAIDGVDVRSLLPEDLPRVFAALTQQGRLLERSVADNLVLGLGEAPTDERLAEALRQVDLAEFASRAPGSAGAAARGLATEVRAVPPNFSGGEQRRILLARLLLREARVLVLDEPEAGLPGATAERILRAVTECARGRTCVVVTHAPHLLRSSFNVVIEAGRVTAVGTHEELLARSPHYRALLAEALRSREVASDVTRAPAPPCPAG
jgi:ABC-type multidrug transport system fused ATPase/permease subunit